jgi:membrane associated rhomboid family serine protease
VFNLKLKRSIGIPVGGPNPSKKRPVATLALMAANVAVYAITSYEGFFLEVGDYWVSACGFVPSLIAVPTQLYRIFASMFLHADFFHILFNMYFLYLFGRAVEDALGRGRFLALYFVSGVAASLFHTAFSFLGGFTAYVIPAIGASGAISGVLGAYLILFPGTSLVMGWAFMFFPIFFRMKAAYYLIFWFATQLIYGYARAAGSTAVFAHAGGFIAGIALLPLVANKERLTQFRFARQIAFPTYVLFTPIKTGGLSRITKTVVAVLLASLLFCAAYASTGLSIQGNIKSTTIQYACNGLLYWDYVGIQPPDVQSQLTNIQLAETRVLINRLYVIGLLYDEDKIGENVSISNENFRLRVNIIGGGFVYVNLVINNFSGRFDGDGFLSYGEGELITQAVNIYTGEKTPMSYHFKLASQTVNLTYITQYTSIPSVFATVVALTVVLVKDKELALIGEESGMLHRPFYATI